MREKKGTVQRSRNFCIKNISDCELANKEMLHKNIAGIVSFGLVTVNHPKTEEN